VAQRVLAVLGAIALVCAAIVIRSALDGDSNDAADDADGRVVVICATELAAACAQLDGVTIVQQDAADTAAAIDDRDDSLDGVDGWVTTSSWIEVVESRSPDRLGDAAALASSPAIVAVDTNRADAVETLCGGDPVWRCLGDNAGAEWSRLGSGGQATWGALKLGLPSADTAIGLSVLASVASGYFGRPDFASNDFVSSEFRGWLANLVAPSDGGERSPVGTLVTARGKYTAVGDLAAAVGARVVEVVNPEPAVTASVVLVDLPGGDRLPDSAPLREALTDAGWDTAAGEPVALLKAGVMAALHTLWMEVTR
jgi:hypothetical protein